MVTVFGIDNPLRWEERRSAEVPDGSTVQDAADALGLECFVARLNGEEVEDDAIVRHGDALYVWRAMGNIGAIAVNLLVSLVVSAAFALLFPPPKPAQRRDEEESPTYTFSGISNNRVEGQPIPIGYGEMKSGGQIINEFIDVRGVPPRTTYRVLISFGEGPFHSVGGVTEDTPAEAPLIGGQIPVGIEINGNPASNFDGVRAWVRLGTNEQDAIPGFDEVRQTFPVGSDLLSEELAGDDVTFQLQTGYTADGTSEYDGTNDAVWDSFGVAYDLDGEDVDGFVVTMRFPQGFVRQDTSTGGTLPVGFGYQVRYIELDSGGTPISTGGPAGDGYVRLPPVGPLSFAQRSPFDLQASGRFQNPQTYDAGAIGKALSLPQTAGSQLAFAPDTDQAFADGDSVNEITVAAWVNFSAFDALDTINIVSCIDVPSSQGFQLRLQPTGTTTLFGGRTSFVYGNGTTFNFLATGGTTPADGAFENGTTVGWRHIVATYSGNDRLVLYVDGRAVFATTNNLGAISWAVEDLVIGDDLPTGAIDDVKVYAEALQPAAVESEFNLGRGLSLRELKSTRTTSSSTRITRTQGEALNRPARSGGRRRRWAARRRPASRRVWSSRRTRRP